MSTSQHGTDYRYTRLGRRCPMCVENHRARIAAERKARLDAGRLNHGTRSAYDAGCRCDECRAARRRAYERYERRSA